MLFARRARRSPSHRVTYPSVTAGADDLGRTITTDRDGVIHQWGSDAAGLFGYSADDIHGRQFDVLIPPALRPLVWRGFNKAIENGYLTRHGGFNVPVVDKAGNLLLARIKVGALTPCSGHGICG